MTGNSLRRIVLTLDPTGQSIAHFELSLRIPLSTAKVNFWRQTLQNRRSHTRTSVHLHPYTTTCQSRVSLCGSRGLYYKPAGVSQTPARGKEGTMRRTLALLCLSLLALCVPAG